MSSSGNIEDNFKQERHLNSHSHWNNQKDSIVTCYYSQTLKFELGIEMAKCTEYQMHSKKLTGQ
jgi:hypothetical protein